MIRPGLVLAFLLLVGPASASGEDALDLSSPRGADLDGALGVLAEGGSLFSIDDEAVGTHAFVVKNATLDIVEWRVRSVLASEIHREATQVIRVPLGDANLTLALSEEFLGVRVAAPDGSRTRVSGAIEGPAAPSILTAPYSRELGDSSDDNNDSAPRVDTDWPAGWAYVAGGDHVDLDTAFPWASPPRLVLDGPSRISIYGGDLTWVEGDRTWQLGQTTEQEIVTLGGARTQVVRRAVLTGDFVSGSLPLNATWAAAAPTARWSVDGTASWDKATGTITRDGATRRFVDESVELTMRGELRPTAPDLDLPGATHAAEGEGEFSRVVISGETFAASSPAAAPVAALSAFALLLALLTKAGQGALAYVFAAYSRLTPDKVLDHPTRRRIVELVRADPGIHLRELHREVGGAWGPFSFHVRTLERAGFLRTATQGRYSLVYPADAAPPADAIPHPVARAIFDALPEDGSPLGATELAARVGISRELLRYHLKALEARGLVGRSDVEGRVAVSRVAPVHAAPAAA